MLQNTWCCKLLAKRYTKTFYLIVCFCFKFAHKSKCQVLYFFFHKMVWPWPWWSPFVRSDDLQKNRGYWNACMLFGLANLKLTRKYSQTFSGFLLLSLCLFQTDYKRHELQTSLRAWADPWVKLPWPLTCVRSHMFCPSSVVKQLW